MPSNLPTQLDKITAFKGKPYTLPLEYEAGYTFSSPTAIVKHRGRELPEAQQPEVTAVDNLLTVELPTALTSVAYNLLDLFIFDGGEPHFTAKVEIAERGGTPDVTGYQVSTPSGTVVQVTVNSLTQFNTYLTQTQEVAQQAIGAAAQTAQDVITTGADAEAVETARGLVQGWWQNVSDWRTTIQGWYNSIQTWFGQIQVWQGEVSSNATLAQQAKTATEALYGNAQALNNAVTQAGQHKTAAETAATTAINKAAEVAGAAEVLPEIINTEITGYALAIHDENDRLLAYAGPDATLHIPKLGVPDGFVTERMLSKDIPGLAEYIDTEVTGWKRVYTQDDVNGVERVLWGIWFDNTIIGNVKVSNLDGALLLDSTVTDNKIISLSLSKLPQDFVRLNALNPLDTTIVEPDDLWRAAETTLPVRTSISGYGFERFPAMATPVLRGINSSGTSIEIRKSPRLTLRGKAYQTTFDPAAGGFTGTAHKGRIVSSSSALPSSSGLVAGDYYEVWSTGTGSRTIGALSAKRGDLIVWNGSTFGVQACPASGPNPGAFWNVSAAGTFTGSSYTTTDRIYCVGLDSDGGVGMFPRFMKQKTGELFLMGEFNPATISPSDIREGDVYIASTGGTYAGLTFAANDYLIRQDSTWGRVACEAVTSVAAGAYFHLPCANAADYEVRRTDKSTTTADLTARIIFQTGPRRNSDALVLWGDSMVETTNGTGTSFRSQLAGLLTGRTVTGKSYGGAPAGAIVDMMQYSLRQSDDFKGRIHIFWFGRNNSADVVQTQMAALRALSLIGAKESRYCFMSILPNRALSYNGSRMVATEAEACFAGTNAINTLENWYEATVPGNFFNTRTQLLAMSASSSMPDPTFPGMTEAQVATTYGIFRFSYVFDWSTKPFTAAQINFVGYWGTAGLPTGGSANDYYIRTGNGSQNGSLIVNVGGTWTEYTYDSTHVTSIGNTDLATAKNNFITSKNW